MDENEIQLKRRDNDAGTGEDFRVSVSRYARVRGDDSADERFNRCCDDAPEFHYSFTARGWGAKLSVYDYESDAEVSNIANAK